MNTVSFPQNTDPRNGRISGEEVQESIYPYHHDANIADGDEFLDDAIRMKDQPFEETNTKENE